METDNANVMELKQPKNPKDDAEQETMNGSVSNVNNNRGDRTRSNHSSSRKKDELGQVLFLSKV